MDHRSSKPSSNSNQVLREREGGKEDPSAARKVLKADREKLRRDRLNEHFQDLANTLDPDRPKNDKATILTETIQMLKDLTAEVNKLKTGHKALSEESRELMQEKNELREEMTSIKSDIDNLNAQYQQRVRIMFPWAAIDHSVVISQPYSYPVPIPIPPAPISIHPSLQPFPFFGNQNPGPMANPCPMYVPYSTPTNPPVELPSALCASTSHVSNHKESRSKSPAHGRPGDAERCSESHDVATELELKMPGSSSTQQDCISGGRKGKHSVMKNRTILGGSASSQYSSSQGLQDSSNSVGDIPKTDN
ncbi:transcription factor bHLH121 [Cajanus cajan]|uniref:transcription factor bHLH121 n=1 Tax=Cajanus cajan TaxID=3821 RepID=UPI00098D7B13|nr:transcription factor bHLH121 [Cajanus cajan]